MPQSPQQNRPRLTLQQDPGTHPNLRLLVYVVVLQKSTYGLSHSTRLLPGTTRALAIPRVRPYRYRLWYHAATRVS